MRARETVLVNVALNITFMWVSQTSVLLKDEVTFVVGRCCPGKMSELGKRSGREKAARLAFQMGRKIRAAPRNDFRGTILTNQIGANSPFVARSGEVEIFSRFVSEYLSNRDIFVKDVRYRTDRPLPFCRAVGGGSLSSALLKWRKPPKRPFCERLWCPVLLNAGFQLMVLSRMSLASITFIAAIISWLSRPIMMNVVDRIRTHPPPRLG
jgi:hypothetical protein